MFRLYCRRIIWAFSASVRAPYCWRYIPALIFSSRKVFFFSKTKSWLFSLSPRSWALPVVSILAMAVWIVTLLQGMMRLFQWTWFKFNFFPFSCETQSSLSSLAPCQTLPRYAASLIWKLLETNSLCPGRLAPLVAASTSCSLPRCSTWSTTYPWSEGSSSTRLLF